jgi:NADPH-dependent 2,4-dienoyl-CoA reductase/sulfur reductase-like enzyme
VPTIYAIGDVASAWNPRYGRRVHVEHWDNAIQQGRTAALNILGRDTVYDRVPYLYSDQYDVGMEYRGFAPDWDEVVIRGDLGRREFHAFWLQRGRIAAAMNVNLWDDGDALQELVASSAAADTDRLSDAEVPLLQAA